jgi:hypothetical protein
MSQQELMPEPQSSKKSQRTQNQGRQSQSGTETYAQPHSWSRRSRNSDLPKSDHPSTFEDSLPPYSYPAQDRTMFRQQVSSEQNTQQQYQERNRAAGTTRETPTSAYQSYSQYNPSQQIPWWTQPQEHTVDSSRWIGTLLLVLVLLVSIPVLCSIGTVFVSVVFMFSFLPVILAFAPIAFFLLIPLFRMLGSESRDHRWRQRR